MSVAFPSGLQVRAWCDMQCRGARCRLQVLECVRHAVQKACHAAEYRRAAPRPNADAACCRLPPLPPAVAHPCLLSSTCPLRSGLQIHFAGESRALLLARLQPARWS